MLSRRTVLLSAASLPLAMAFARTAAAGVPPVYAEKGIAIDSTDCVAYFTEKRPVAGQAEIALKWRGALWRFASLDNRAAFEANPLAYAPQYGGYCAWAMSEGYTSPTVPEAWRIVNGKLYLNYSRSVLRKWEQDIPGRIARANANWPGLIG